MSWDKIRVIVKKEWADTFRNKLVFFSLVFLPLVLTVLPLVNLYVMGTLPAEEAGEDLGPFQPYLAQMGLNPLDPESARLAVMVGMASIFMIIFLMIPLMIPMMIATDSIVSEKVSKSLEPLLATPVSVIELLLAKALAAVGPAVGVTWVCYALYGALAASFVPPQVLGIIFGWEWIAGILLLAPLLALLAVSLGIVVSSRVNDTRSAQQISGLVVLPLLLLLVPMFLGGLILNLSFFLVVAAVAAVLDVAAMAVARALFQRETILTRWR